MNLIVCAMMDEAKYIASKMNLIESKPFEIYEGIIADKKILLIISGIGKANAAMATTYALTKYNFDLIINLGIVGGYKVEKFGTYLVSKSSYHDFDLTIFNYQFGQVPKFPAIFDVADDLLNKYINFKQVPLYTGDSFSTSIINDFAYVADMEGAAIAQVVHKFNKALLMVKIVSDVIGANDQLDSYKELESSFDVKLYEELVKILEA